jgi:hypothetical protein
VGESGVNPAFEAGKVAARTSLSVPPNSFFRLLNMLILPKKNAHPKVSILAWLGKA